MARPTLTVALALVLLGLAGACESPGDSRGQELCAANPDHAACQSPDIPPTPDTSQGQEDAAPIIDGDFTCEPLEMLCRDNKLLFCQADGVTVDFIASCGDGVCSAEDEACVDCVPDCAGRECGPDGCGGTCGSCGGGETCLGGGTCVSPGDDCVDSGACTPAVNPEFDSGVFTLTADLSGVLPGTYLRMVLDMGQVCPSSGGTLLIATAAGKTADAANNSSAPEDIVPKLNDEGWAVLIQGAVYRLANGDLYLQTVPRDLDIRVLGLIRVQMDDVRLEATIEPNAPESDDRAHFRGVFRATKMQMGDDGGETDLGEVVAPWEGFSLFDEEVAPGLPRVRDEEPCAALIEGGGDCQLPLPWTAPPCGGSGPDPDALVGGACEEDEDCALDFCFNDEFVQNVAPDSDLAIPGGTCSSNPFTTTGETDCGPSGFVQNLEPVFGIDARMCLLACDGATACRWDEGYTCHQLDPDQQQEGCLPASFVQKIEADRARGG